MNGKREPLAHILREGLPRKRPPRLSLESLLEQEQAHRRRRLALALGALALLLGGFLLSRGHEAEPPVYLKLRVVDAMPGEGGLAGLETTPRELRGP